MHVYEPERHFKHIQTLINDEQSQELHTYLETLDTVDIVNTLLLLKLDHQLDIIDQLNSSRASDVLSNLQQHTPVFVNILENLSSNKLREFIGEMPSDDAADLISTLDDTRATEVLDNLPDKDRSEIKHLLQYDEESAGGLMNPYVVSVRQNQTISEAINSIRAFIAKEELQTFYTVYVVDEHEHLVGSIQLLDLLLAVKGSLVQDIMDPHVVAVDVDLDQEAVARIAQEYDLVVVPVIDKHLRLLGRITIDDLVDVIYQESQEDIAHIAGTGDEEVLEASIFRASRDRLPWLLLGLMGGILTAFVMSYYEHSLASAPHIVYFIPLIAALGGNIGIQSSSIVVRGLATGEIRHSDLFTRLWRELRVGMLNGIVCAGILALITWVFLGNLHTGVTVGIALLIVIGTAATVGSTVPMLLKRLNIDPALATGPFITTTNDILGVSIYLAITLKNWEAYFAS